MPRSNRLPRLARILVCSIGLALAGPALALADTVRFEIKAEPLTVALKAFAQQAHMQLLYEYAIVRNVRGNPVVGVIEKRAALEQLLRNTGLEATFIANDAATIRAIPRHTPIDTPKSTFQVRPAKPSVRIKQPESAADPSGAPKTAGRSPDDPRNSKRAKSPGAVNSVESLREIIITGTHIVGIKSSASFSSTYSRDYMHSTGAGSLAQFIQQLPGNFAEASDVSIASTQGGPGFALNNNVAAAGIDIHGLGVQSTLVLVNGFRLAPGNYNGGFVDISMLPLSAIDHVDIVADSASAIYGSDAVGGVANVVTLRRFPGEETRVRYGSVTDGGRHEVQASETAGTSWADGSAVLSYQYSDTTPLSASSRSFSREAASPFNLLPGQLAHELYGSLTESLSDSTTVSGFLIYGHRDAAADFVDGGIAALKRDGTVESGISAVDLQRQFDWGGIGRASVEYSQNDSTWTDAYAFLPNPTKYTLLGTVEGKSRLGSIDVGLSGGFGGRETRGIRYAVGGQVRDERYSYAQSPVALADSRTVSSEYIEFWVPVVRSLDVSVDGRHERYSDFGSTNNGKLGVLWRAGDAFTARATYSTAFRAPSLYDLLNIDQAGFSPVPDTSTSGACAAPGPGCTNTLVLTGGNPGLSAEKAKTWTVGIELTPPSLTGADLELSFYDIRYYDRINAADSAINILGSLENDRALLGSTLVRENVPSQEIQQLANLAGPSETFIYGGVDPATVTTFIDDRLHNLAALTTRGVDFKAAYLLRRGGYQLRSGISGTRIIRYDNRFTPRTPAVDSLDTAYNPIGLKMRLDETLEVRHFIGSVFINYAGRYVNNAIVPSAPVASWTTVDASITYDKGLDRGERERKASLTFGVFNLLDRSPPFVRNPYFPVNFDGANASPLGRFVYAEIRVVL